MTGIALYALISAMVGVAAVACWDLPSSDEQRRTSARIALTCWAWPVWAIVGLALLLLGLLIDFDERGNCEVSRELMHDLLTRLGMRLTLDAEEDS